MVRKTKTESLELFLKALANEKRIRIIQFLSKGRQMSVSDIASKLRISVEATSTHLKKLLREGIIERNRRAKEVFYRLARKKSPLLRAVLKEFL